jgi:hypothetical protein
MTSPLLDRTHELIDAREESLREVAKGAQVGYEWLSKFAHHRIQDPSIRRVQSVHDYLAGKVDPAANTTAEQQQPSA